MEMLYSVEEAAKILGGVSKWTIHAWLSQGKIKKTKVGSRTMIRESELEAFLAECNKRSNEANPHAQEAEGGVA